MSPNMTTMMTIKVAVVDAVQTTTKEYLGKKETRVAVATRVFQIALDRQCGTGIRRFAASGNMSSS